MRARGGPIPTVRCAHGALEVPGRVHGSTAAEKSYDERCAVTKARALLRLSAGKLDSGSSGPGACAEIAREGERRRRRGGARAHGAPSMAVRRKTAKSASLPTMAAAGHERTGGAGGGGARAHTGEA